MNRRIIIGLVVGGLIGAAGLMMAVVFQAFSAGMYVPGQLAERVDLEPLPQSDEGWTVAPDIVLHHTSKGSGDPVLYVHGWTADPVLPPGLEALADVREVHQVHLRGHGHSTRPVDELEGSFNDSAARLDEALGIGEQVADLERMRRLLGVEQLDLVCHSFGGLLCTLYAVEFPEHVGRMVLISPAELIVMPPESGGLYEQVRSRLPASEHEAYDAWLTEYFEFDGLWKKTEAELVAEEEAFADFYAQAVPWSPTLPEGFSGGWVLRANALGLGWRHDWTGDIDAVKTPTLVLHGADDIQPESASRRYAELIDGADLTVIPGVGHFPHHEDPAAFEAAVEPFLGR